MNIDIENSRFTVLQKNSKGQRTVHFQYPIALMCEEHKCHGTQALACKRTHHQWDLVPVSEWMKVETKYGTYHQIDHAFCEFIDGSNFVEVKVLRYQSDFGPNYENP